MSTGTFKIDITEMNTSEILPPTFQLAFTCLKSTKETPEQASLLLTLNRFNTLFCCFYYHFERANAYWVCNTT